MLGKGRWYMIRTMRQDGLSVSEISRKLGVDRKTVRKALSKDSWPDDHRPRVLRPSKLDAFKPYIDARLEQAALSAVRIYEEILPQGYDGRLSILRDYVRGVKDEQRMLAVVRFETMPGEQSQVDWIHMGNGIFDAPTRPVYGFAMVLGWSRCRFVTFRYAMDLNTLMRCHIEAFRYFGGYTRELLYDNLKTVIQRPRTGETAAVVNPAFADFAGYYGFRVGACAPYRAQTKGKVERLARYVKDNFFLGREFTSLDDLNHQARMWCDRVNSKVHGTTGLVPSQQVEREGLIPLPATQYDTSRSSIRIVSRDCFISYESSRYEMPYRLAGSAVVVRDDDDGRIRVFRDDELVIEHERALGRGEVVRKEGLNDELWRKILGRNWANRCERSRPSVGERPSIMLVGGAIPDVEVEHRALGYYEEAVGG